MDQSAAHLSPLLISFYTLDTPYEQEVKRLIGSCDVFGIEYCIEGKPSQGSWENNCAVKPFYILEKLQQFKRSVLWVDADAAFLKFPELDIFLSADLSVRFMELFPDDRRFKIASGTIFVNYTFEGIQLMEKWCRECEKLIAEHRSAPAYLDQMTLLSILEEKSAARIKPMPIAYCKIFDYDSLFIEDEEVVIEHYQASRRFKSQIR